MSMQTRRVGWRVLTMLGLCLTACQTPTPSPPAASQAAPLEPALERIAFGSCAKQTLPQPIWDTLHACHPDLFLFIGDTAYVDSTDTADMRSTFAALAAIPGYQTVRADVPIHAIWDDHDYGINDGGAEHPNKVGAQRAFLEFFDEPRDSPRWDRAGLYHAWTYGPPGRRVQILFLDTRYDRGPLKGITVGKERLYRPNTDPSVPMLGAEQWRWLEQRLQDPADIRLIVSTIQVIPDDHPFEKWANLPHERRRLLELLRDLDGVIVLSGDQHLAELSLLPRAGTYDLVELTASGMTHNRGVIPAPNRHRVGRYILDHHFGLVDFDWPGQALTLRIIDVEGRERLTRRIGFAELGGE